VGKLFLLFTIVPLLDFWLLVHLAQPLGVTATVALIVLPSLVGAWLARREGLRVLRAWQNALREGRTPEEGLTSAALVLAGGVLLVAPGLVTDVTGLALLFPPTRRIAVRLVRAWVRRKIDTGAFRVATSRGRFREEPIDVTPRR
jgi:UPF0716 protein FxsA